MNQSFTNLFVTCDAPRPWGIYFQDSASPQMEALIELHDKIMFYLVIILFGVAWILISVVRNYVNDKSPISNKYLNHGTLIEYYSSYKRRLGKLLGKESVSNLTSFIFMPVIALLVILILIIIAFFAFAVFGLLSVLCCEPVYCMDPLTEELLAKISKVQRKVQYFAEQAGETEYLYKEAKRYNLPDDMKAERLLAKKETETNLNVEKKVLKVLKHRLDSGDYNTSLSTSSSLGKRNFDQQ